MKAAADLPDLAVRAPRGGGVVLAGAPGRLRGELHVTNGGALRSSLRGFAVPTHDLPEQPAPGQLGVHLQPDESTDVTASLELAPGTPPGEYHATLDVAGHAVEATLYVSPDPALELTPSRVFVEPGTTRVRLVLRNTGNVHLAVAPTARARLTRDPDLAALPLGRPADGDRSSGPDGPDAVLRVAGPAGLDPGETLVVDAEVEVGGDLDPERRHLALLPVATGTLRVVVNPHVPAATPSTTKTRPGTAPRRPRTSHQPRSNDA